MLGIKELNQNNPVITHKYTADPYALSYNGRVYLYMTGDERMYEADGSIKTNNYSNINTIRVISSEDLVNWEDHGDILAAGINGASKWGNNSWAPAACMKVIDGKPKFFLYFANSGNGIAVLTSDSPVGPFTDPLGEALVSRNTKTCAEVTWLFDPAVLVDDDGTGYLYFGGGIPSDDKVSNPGTARVCKLADDMIHLDGDPVPIEEVLYLFEDSGINKIGDKYIYSYCSNFNVPNGGLEGYGFESGEIITMVSDSPMGPFKMIGGILKNPGYFFKNGGNNHHCMFQFNDKWYVTYHASLIEEKLSISKGYRSVNIDEINVNEDGVFDVAKATKEGVSQIKHLDPFKVNPFVLMADQDGIKTIPADDISSKCGSLKMNLVPIKNSAFIRLKGVDFKDGAKDVKIEYKGNGGLIKIATINANGEACYVGNVTLKNTNERVIVCSKLDENITGIVDLMFEFDGLIGELHSWQFC